MVTLLSLLTAALFGTSDFLAGVLGRRLKILEVMVGSHIVGLASITVVSVAAAGKFSAVDVGWGGLAGIAGFVGLALLYRGLARGPMGVVAPLTAIMAAAVPALWGILLEGDVLGWAAWAGIGAAFLAIGLVSWSTNGDEADDADITMAGIGEALLGGVGFGFMFVILAQTEAASAPWPIVGARLVTASALVIFFVSQRRQMFPRARPSLLLVVAVGFIDTAANAVFLYAQQRGSLTVVGVLSALYPVATVFLARVFLGERLTPVRQAGFVTAMVATALLAFGGTG